MSKQKTARELYIDQLRVRLERVRGGIADADFLLLLNSMADSAERFAKIDARSVTSVADALRDAESRVAELREPQAHQREEILAPHRR